MVISRSALLFLVSLAMAEAHPRIDRIINSGWKFTRGDAPGADSAAYDDSGWEKIPLPHTWNALDGQDGGNNYYRGTGWYRVHLDIPSSYRGRNFFLKFDAASTAAHVFVNGHPAGEHRGGFGAFCVDASPFLRPGAPNVVAVNVSNAPDPDVPPLRGDFTVFGGLYRSVHLLVLDSVSLSPLDDGSPGVMVRQTHVDAETGVARVSAVLRNGTGGGKAGILRCVVRDGGGRSVRDAEWPVVIPPGGHAFTFPDIVIDHPHLWQGREDPYLYTVDISLTCDGILRDRIAQPLGFRSFRVDPERGFFLNGKPYPIHGVNRHQDRESMGWAIGPEQQEEDFRLMIDMGCTAVRLAHYQHAQEFYDLCDRGGIVVWAELALVDEIHPSAAFAASCRDQLRELIKQNFNHPSILFWSLSNELIPGGNEKLYTGLITDLDSLAKTLDPGRLTTLASRGDYDWSVGINNVTDVTGYNLYKGWYEKMPGDFGPAVDALHSRRPDRAFCISEYGAGAGIHQHESPARKPEPAGPWHPEEWQSFVHESTWRQIASRPWIWGSFVWNMFDFASDGRSEGELPGRNDKGLMTYDRKVKKDAYFWYRANWNPSPMVYVTERRFSPRPPGQWDVRVYTNCGVVGLSVNGQSAGTGERTGNVAVWHNVALRDGANRIEAFGSGASGSARDSCTVVCRSGAEAR